MQGHSGPGRPQRAGRVADSEETAAASVSTVFALGAPRQVPVKLQLKPDVRDFKGREGGRAEGNEPQLCSSEEWPGRTLK